jgi:hypothetical protein
VPTQITDEYMHTMLAQAKAYTVVLLNGTPKLAEDGAASIVWEHGRRNFSLREDGLLSIVCPVTDGGDLAGIYVFDTDPEHATRIMRDDPGVRAGVFTFEVHPCRGFPGDALGS